MPTSLASLSVGTSVTVLPFAAYSNMSSIDSNNLIAWRKVSVQLNGVTLYGYIDAHSLNGIRYRPGDHNDAPRANATIRGLGQDRVAVFADRSSRDADAITIPHGARVRVLGTFNSSAARTQINYFFYNQEDDMTVSVTRFVDTRNVDFDNITVMQISAFVIVVVLLSLLALIVFMYRAKRLKVMEV
jgi:branched-subunit amino acid ABC-type transport system permease component